MSYDTEHYYALHTFLEDDELHEIWNIVEKAMNREGYDVSNAELSMRLYDSELTEDIECDMEHLLSSQSEGKDYDITFTTDDDYANGFKLTFDEEIELRDLTLGVWEADDEDDLIEEITASTGWCIKNIDYDIQLK